MPVAQEQYANNPSSTINQAGGIGAADTTVVVANASSFPAVPQFRAMMDAEIVLVTGASGNTWTISRGQEGTAAATHANGTAVYGILTKAALENLLTVQTQDGVTQVQGVRTLEVNEPVLSSPGSQQALLDLSALHVHIENEDHSASCNGATTVFTTTYGYVAGTTSVHLNGLTLRPGAGNDYTETGGGTTVTLAVAPQTGDILTVSYEKSGTFTNPGAGNVATDLYVATTGSDVTGTGTAANPFKSLAHALAQLPSTLDQAYTVHVSDGTYAEPIVLKRFRGNLANLLTILGNTTTPGNVQFTGTTTSDGGNTTGGEVTGPVCVKLSGLEINVTAYYGLTVEHEGSCVVDRCTITGTISSHGVNVSEFGKAEFQGNCTVSGFGGNGINIYGHSIGTFTVAGTLTVTGTGGSSIGIVSTYKGLFVVGWVSGLNISISNVLQGIGCSLGSIWQHYSGGGSISLTNSSTPANSVGVQTTDVSSFSTSQPLTINHFSEGFNANSLSYQEAIGSRTLTNVGTPSIAAQNSVIYLP